MKRIRIMAAKGCVTVAMFVSVSVAIAAKKLAGESKEKELDEYCDKLMGLMHRVCERFLVV